MALLSFRTENTLTCFALDSLLFSIHFRLIAFEKHTELGLEVVQKKLREEICFVRDLNIDQN